MKRLTERDDYDYIEGKEGSAFTYTDIQFCGDCYVGEVIDKLADYEDLEEQGLLLRLPCKVGDAVCVLVGMDKSGKYTRLKHDFIKCIYQSEDGEWMISFRYVWHDTFLNDIGNSVFLTKKEAENKLKELQSI